MPDFQTFDWDCVEFLVRNPMRACRQTVPDYARLFAFAGGGCNTRDPLSLAKLPNNPTTGRAYVVFFDTI
jgi:hypothetical protein